MLIDEVLTGKVKIESLKKYRVLHDREIVYPAGHKHYGEPVLWRHTVPEVFHFNQIAAWKITEPWQKLIMALNPGMLGDSKPIDDGGGYRNLLWYNLAFTNGPGYDNPNGIKRADFINHRDESAKPPVADKGGRICGGAIVLAQPWKGNTVRVLALNGTKAPPSIAWLKERRYLYFECLTVHEDGSNGRFPQNGHGARPVFFPFAAGRDISIAVGKPVYGKPFACLREIND